MRENCVKNGFVISKKPIKIACQRTLLVNAKNATLLHRYAAASS
jgi:hypothetical protein